MLSAVLFVVFTVFVVGFLLGFPEIGAFNLIESNLSLNWRIEFFE